jgi:hypothetical protein
LRGRVGVGCRRITDINVAPLFLISIDARAA